MESGHAEAASMAATAANSGDLLDRSPFDLSGVSVEEHNELVKSGEQHRPSVGRIILANKRDRKEVIQTGTAFLVYKGDERSLFLTCSHNFEKKRICGEVIRLLPTTKGHKVKDYPIEKIVYRHESRDILLFTVKDLLPGRERLELSTDEVKKNDKVVLVGFSGGSLLINNEEYHRPAPVLAHSIFSGVVLAKYGSQTDQHHEQIYYACSQAVRGHSGSPVCKNGKVVAVHIAADRTWRDGVSTANTTVRHCLREHLKRGTDDEATIDQLLEDFYEKVVHVKKRKGRN